jgi:MgtC family
MVFKSYFTEYNAMKGFLYGLMVLFVISFTAVAVLQPLLSPSDCHVRITDDRMTFENALYAYNPCWLTRARYLLYMTPEECDFCRRLLASVVGGAMIGWERREADRPAGIRTMCLVSLGSALFTINSAYAFVQGPMAWDASRIAAAIPSGVGFLGSALIL